MVFGWLKGVAFEESLTDPRIFRTFVRRAAYMQAGGDPERVHELALEALNEYEDSIRKVASQFDAPNLHVDLFGHDVMPFGTAAGLDKNGDALSPLSHLFGFLEPGTVIVNPREGNKRPRVAVDEASDTIYNAQGFPSKGLEYFVANAEKYRQQGGRAPLLISVCGIPPSPDQIDVAYQELETLVTRLNPYATGFVWNPFSPNTAALTALRTTAYFRRSAELIGKLAPAKPKLVKMGPYSQDSEKTSEWLSLVGGWMEGGGQGVVAVNTFMVPKEQVPSETWGYASAGRSGTHLQQYRQRAIRDTRKFFPASTIIAAGGIDSADQAWEALKAGADALEGYTPYTFHGFGLILEMARGIEKRLQDKGYKTLKEFLSSRK